jgi:hypothetical protein
VIRMLSVGLVTLHTRAHFAYGVTTCDRSLNLESGHLGCKVNGSG